MFQPKSYAVQLVLMVVSMCCWGSWANTLKLTPGWRFQSFYWDFVVGLFLASLAFGTVLGGGAEFFHGLMAPSLLAIGYALVSGIIFNAANQLLVAAIDLAGLAVVLPRNWRVTELPSGPRSQSHSPFWRCHPRCHRHSC
jgi:glucose uptake protein